MKRYKYLSFVAGISGIACDLLFTVLAFPQASGRYFPLENWLSDLGNVDFNPGGAVFYNIGIITTGILLPAFFLGLPR
jgi:hypothetical membrane protein